MLHSIIVGVDQYLDPDIKNLSYARADAEAFGKLIEAHIHPSEYRVRLLLDEDATKRNLMKVIGDDLPRLAQKADDVILLYFACHGSPETGSCMERTSRYLILHDTEFENIYSTGIDLERDLPRWFNRIHNPKLIILFIDACFSGRAGGRTFEGPYLSHVRANFRGTSPISLKSLDLGEGRLMVVACDDDQIAYENRELGHGVFTYFLIEGLRRSDSNKNVISIHTLYEKVAEAVRDFTNGRQVPVINGRSRIARLPYFG